MHMYLQIKFLWILIFNTVHSMQNLYMYSQTSIKAPPFGVSYAGCYTQVAVLSRFSQSSCHVENILTITRKILSKEGLPVCVSSVDIISCFVTQKYIQSLMGTNLIDFFC